jgi:hypothetical protein
MQRDRGEQMAMRVGVRSALVDMSSIHLRTSRELAASFGDDRFALASRWTSPTVTMASIAVESRRR